MPSEWPLIPLGEVSLNLDTRRKPVKEAERVAGPYPYYGASGIVDFVGGYLFDGEYLLVAEDGENLRTRNTPIAFRVAGKFWVNNHAHIIQGNGKASTRYLEYAVLSADIGPYLTGAVMPKLTQGNLNKILVPCPPIEIQDQVVGVLGALDDKIALLRETNATLEAIAQALFKSWFVDFDPVRAKAEGRDPIGMPPEVADLFPSEFEDSELGEIPKGWKAMRLDQASEINPTRRIGKGVVAPYLEMAAVPTKGHRPEAPVRRAFSSGTKFINGDTLLARITPCLENGKTAFVDFLESGTVGWGSTEYIIMRPKPPLLDFWAYLLCRHEPFRQFAIQAMVGTSGRQRVEVSRLAQYPVAVPDDQVAGAFAAIVEPLRARIATHDEEAKTLSSLRDNLLPRLMSGKLRIPEASEQLEDTQA